MESLIIELSCVTLFGSLTWLVDPGVEVVLSNVDGLSTDVTGTTSGTEKLSEGLSTTIRDGVSVLDVNTLLDV